MGLPQEKEFDRVAFMLDKYAFKRWARENQLDTEYMELLLNIIERAQLLMCTPIQRAYIYEYFTNRRTMVDIAEMYSVNKATVSRTISRAIVHIAKVMYCMDKRFAPVVERFEPGPRERKKQALRINKRTKIKGGDSNGQ